MAHSFVTDNSTDITEQNYRHLHNPSTGTDDTFDSRKRHPNFHKFDGRVKRLQAESPYVIEPEGHSRYCVKGQKSDIDKKLNEIDDPYYFYTIELGSSSLSSSSSSVADTLEPQNGCLLEGDSNIKLEHFIMTQEELRSMDKEFPSDVNPFKRKIDYFNPFIYITHFYWGQIFAAIALFCVFIFGTLGYLITVVKKLYSPVPPEVYEVLSPYKYPNLAAIRTSLIDPDTPKDSLFKESFGDGSVWELVFSDEFNADGRTFFEGDDPYFTAVDIHYASTNDLEYYIPEMIETRNGSLRITLDAFPTNGLLYRSGMLQSWNKLCYSKHAHVEVSIKMPGYSQENGLWPAVWSLGNLARPGFQATTDGVWPYTYDECDYGITPNQSSTDGISFLPGQRLSKCTCYGEDHPNLGVGRGAPEIDIIEGFHNENDKTMLGIQTMQVAPFDPWWRPDYDYMFIHDSNITSMKADTGTPTQEAIAAGTVLNDKWFHTVRNDSDYKDHLNKTTYFQKFGYEYLSDKSKDRDSYLQFFASDKPTVGIRGDALHPVENIGWRQITKEPMSLVFNLGLSETWSNIDYGSLEFPAVFEIDYIRIYQPKGDSLVTCDPPDYPTTEYIYQHMPAYENFNFTTWEQAGFQKPKNSLMDSCLPPYGM